MTVYLATKTMKAIEEQIASDQGIEFRRNLALVLPHMKDAYRTDPEGHRSHMGASMIAKDCGRAIWYNFRWAVRPKFEGRMIRLFNRGHLEEARFIAMLLAIGCEVYQQDAAGNQFRISDCEGHFGGSGDGIVVGIPDLDPGIPALGEFKTHNNKSFTELKAKGLLIAKPEHYGQMTTYMEKMRLAVGLYAAVNKDNDEVYMELIHLNSAYGSILLERANKLVWAQNPPEKIGKTPGFWKCKWCDYSGVCHGKETPDVNCRTCQYSQPSTNATWTCTNDICPGPIPKDLMLTGCSHYEQKVDF